MMTTDLLAQCIFDGLLLALCSLGLLGRGRGKWDGFLPLLFAAVCIVARLFLGLSEDELFFAIFPAVSLVNLLFFGLAILLIHSVWFKASEGQLFFGTVAAFALFLFLRELCFAGFRLCGLDGDVWYLYIGRMLSLALWLTLWAAGGVRWLRERLADGDMPVRIVACDSAILLLSALVVLQLRGSSLSWTVPVMAAVLALLVLANGAVLLVDQHRIQTQRKNQLLEQYLPLVDELVEQVRARQHQFNNQMMSVSGALATAEDLPEARARVADLIESTKLDGVDTALLKCDSKVLSGMLYGKVKQAELRHIRLEVDLSAPFLHNAIPETGWIEVAGILIDNALESSSSDDVVSVRAALEDDGAFRFTVSNPHAALSNVEFVQMFRRGWSSKGNGHGYGLYNVRQIVEHHGGRLVTRNDVLGGMPYVTIGIQISY